MYINYQPGKNGIIYGSVSKTVRKDGRIYREITDYLGRVLDKDRLIFKNRKDGIFQYDPKTETKLPAPADFKDTTKRKNAKECELLLDFGDAYFLDQFFKRSDVSKWLDAIDYGNKDSVCSVLMFYMLSSLTNCHAQTWYEGNYARILCPNANISSQRISDMLRVIGTEACYQRFFKAYFEFLDKLNKEAEETAKKEQAQKDTDSENDPSSKPKTFKVVDGQNIVIDSTGLPNSIHFPLTAVSNHNGEINEEVRLIYVTQQGTGLPIYMRYVPGNVIDASTLITTMNELKAQGVKTKFALLDAGYVTKNNLIALHQSDVSYMARLPENRNIFKDVVANHTDDLQKDANLVRYGDRLVYIKRFKCEVINGVEGYVYLGLDPEQKYLQQKKIGVLAKSDDMSIARVKTCLKNKGIFALVSSRCIARENVLPLYYRRQEIEQVFDLGKNYASMLPVCTQDETTFRGHLLMTFMATAIMRQIQTAGKKFQWDLPTLLSTLRNQKCKVFAGMIVPQEATANQNKIYKDFKIDPPKWIDIGVA